MAIFISYPWIAIVVAVIFAALWAWKRRRVSAFCAFAWLVYAGYEYLMLTRTLCSGECNIRVDLLLIYPFLFVTSIVATVQTVRMYRRRAA